MMMVLVELVTPSAYFPCLINLLRVPYSMLQYTIQSRSSLHVHNRSRQLRPTDILTVLFLFPPYLDLPWKKKTHKWTSCLPKNSLELGGGHRVLADDSNDRIDIKF